MLATKLYTEEYDVDARLASFGITRAELVDILKLILSARSDAIHVDPLGAAGQFSFIYGTRHIRLLLCPKGWVINRKENIESVRNDGLKISIVFQNVDQACVPTHSPKALHSKGAGSTRLVDQGQGSLFPDGEVPEVIPAHKLKNLNSAVWYFCASFHGESAQAELSLPATLKGANFGVFLERIFITLKDDNPLIARRETDQSGPAESEPIISKK